MHVLECLSTSLQEWLLDGRIQVAVVYNQPLLEAFDVRPIFSERMVLVGPPGRRQNRCASWGWRIFH
ncbi:LysR substrate-binding domain-containing protein [Pseudomonas pergaminensis]|uniref:LysR substrate-binding domain-containing protein n=1 Tax=Pseudomonas pergaminensis TaxID=2853159 RepID=UPI0034D552FE